MISPNRCGVTARRHVAIKNTRRRLIAFGPFRGVFIGEYLNFHFTRFGRLINFTYRKREKGGPESTGLEPATSAVTGRRSNQLS